MTAINRTPKEILARIDEVKDTDFFGAETGDLLCALPFPDAQQFLNDGVTEKQWAGSHYSSREAVIAEATEYLDFAIGKMVDKRGLSANRSIDHYRAWLWLAFDDEQFERFDSADYGWYGDNQLRIAAELLGASDKFDVIDAGKEAGDWT